MQSGTSVRLCASGTAWRINSTSSASGSPTLTSRTSAAPCSATSISICDRSPAWSWAWNAFRPVGLIRSPMTQNGCSLPMTTVLDRDWMTVSTRFPFDAGGDAELAAQAGDAGLSAEADQVQAGEAGQPEGMPYGLEPELEARLLRIGGLLAALDVLGRHGDPRHLLVDEAERGRGAHEADRRDQRRLRGEPARDRAVHEALQLLAHEAD